LGRRASDTTVEGEPSTLAVGTHSARPNRLTIVFGALALVALVIPFAIECFGIAVSPGPGRIYLGGDQALIAMATRAAAGWHQLLGPYDQFGWQHPGPAYFYLQSLPSHLLPSAQASFFGSVAIDAVAGLLAVGTVWRRVGDRAALWTAICIGFLALALGPAVVRTPWNPFAVVVPICLLAILCAATATGSRLCLLASLLVGSYLVQTDIATAPLVLVLVVLSSVTCVIAGRTGMDRTAPRPWPPGLAVVLAGVGAATLMVMWVPPLIQQASGHPGNLTLLWRFFTAGHPHHSVGAAVNAVGATDSVLGFRSVDSGVLSGSHHLAVVAALLLAAATVALALWRRHRFGLALGVASLLGQLVAIAAVTRVVGPIYGYLVLWEVALPVVAAIGLGVVVVGDVRELTKDRARTPWAGVMGRTSVAVALGLGAAAVAAVLGLRATQLPPISTLSTADVGQAWHLVAPQLRSGDSSVQVDIRSPASWPVAVGLADQLDQRRLHPTFPAQSARIFGTKVATGREPAVVAVYGAGLAPPTPPPGFRYLGAAGDGVLYLWQRPAVR
jgi:hypothetical protein